MSFMHLAPTPDEPGVQMDSKWGPLATAEPSLTIPRTNPYFEPLDPRQPTAAWETASTDDIFVHVDAKQRFTAVLKHGTLGITSLPYRQNLVVALSGAVTVYDAETGTVTAVSGYVVSGAAVTLPSGSYPDGTMYMVEFMASPAYVAFRKAGGLEHIRSLGAGTVLAPRRFRLQELDFWLRDRSSNGLFGQVSYPPPPAQSPYA